MQRWTTGRAAVRPARSPASVFSMCAAIQAGKAARRARRRSTRSSLSTRWSRASCPMSALRAAVLVDPVHLPERALVGAPEAADDDADEPERHAVLDPEMRRVEARDLRLPAIGHREQRGAPIGARIVEGVIEPLVTLCRGPQRIQGEELVPGAIGERVGRGGRVERSVHPSPSSRTSGSGRRLARRVDRGR